MNGVAMNRIIKLKVIFIFLIFISSCGCQEVAENETFVIPKDYSGVIYIFFDQRNGEAIEYDSQKRRVYQIPNSGILKTQFTSNYGVTDSRIYYDGSLNGNIIDYIKRGETLNYKNEKIVAAWYQTGTAYIDQNDSKSDQIHFIKLYISKPSDIEKLHEKSLKIYPTDLLK